MKNIKARQPAVIPEKVRKAILKVLDYSFDDEARHAEECLANGDSIRGHIFVHLVTLHNAVNGQDRKPKDFLELPK